MPESSYLLAARGRNEIICDFSLQNMTILEIVTINWK